MCCVCRHCSAVRRTQCGNPVHHLLLAISVLSESTGPRIPQWRKSALLVHTKIKCASGHVKNAWPGSIIIML